MTTRLTSCIGFALFCSSLSAQIPAAAANTKPNSELQAAIQRREAARQLYKETQEAISSERAELNQAILPLEQEADRLRTELDKLLRGSENFAQTQRNLKQNIENFRVEYDYATGQTRTYLDSASTRLSGAELQTYGEKYKRTQSEVINAGDDITARMLASFKGIQQGLERLDQGVGGSIFPGKAALGGTIHEGQFVLFGPQAYFSSNDGKAAGIAQMNGEDPFPTLLDLGEGTQAQIQQLAKGQEAEVKLDPTSGFGTKNEVEKETLAQHLEKGGEVGYLTVILGVMAWLIAAYKFIQIGTIKAPKPKHIHQLLEYIEAGDKVGAIAYGKKIGGAAGRLISVAGERFDAKRRVLEELLFEQLVQLKPKIESYLPFLAVTATAAPLMGLLGTVMGMITTFKVITEKGTGDPRNLAGGIAEALVTTELGLVVAIPTLILHGILKRNAKDKIGRYESACLALLNGLNDLEIVEESDDSSDGGETALSAEVLQPA